MDDDRPAAATPLEREIRAAWQAGDWRATATAMIAGYGDEILGYLLATTRTEADAQDAFSIVCEAAWTALPTFRWDASCRTWLYTLARSALGRVARDPYARRRTTIDDPHVAALAQEVRSRTSTFVRTDTKDRFAELRAELAPDDQTLLILRLNRELGWRDIARVMADPTAAGAGAAETDDESLTRAAAALRKRFERLKAQLRERMRATSE